MHGNMSFAKRFGKVSFINIPKWFSEGAARFLAYGWDIEMDNIIRDNIIDSRTTRIITRSGIVTNINNLRKVQAEKAKSIIIMNSAASWKSKEELKLADALVLKSIMSIKMAFTVF